MDVFHPMFSVAEIPREMLKSVHELAWKRIAALRLRLATFCLALVNGWILVFLRENIVLVLSFLVNSANLSCLLEPGCSFGQDLAE